MAFSILAGSVVIIIIIMICFAYGYSMDKYIENTINKNASLRYSDVINEDVFHENLFQVRNESEGIQSICEYNLYQLCKDNDLEIQAVPLENHKVSFDAAILEIDDKKYEGTNDYSYDFNLTNDVIHSRKDRNVEYFIGIMDYDNNLQVSNNEIEELNNKFNKHTVYIQGGGLTDKNQIIMTDYMLEKFGYDGDIKSCVGKKVSLYVKTDKGDVCIINNYTLQGIIDRDLYRVGSRKNVPQILVSNADEKYYGDSSIKVFSESFNDVIKLLNHSTEFYLLPTEVTTEYSAMEKLSTFFNKIVIRIFSVILISILVFVNTVIYFYFKKRTKYICMERAMGVNNKDMYRMIFFELLVMAAASICIAIPLFYAFINYLNVIVNSLVGSSYRITGSDIKLSCIVAVIIELILMVGISYVEYNKTKKYSVVNREI